METWRNKQRGRRWWSLKFWGSVWARNAQRWYRSVCGSVLWPWIWSSSVCLCRYYNGVHESGPRLAFDIESKPQAWSFTSGSLHTAQFYLLYFTGIELWLVYQARIVDYAVICGASTGDCVSLALEAKPQVAWQYPADWPSLFSNWWIIVFAVCFYSSREDVVCVEREDFTVFARGESVELDWGVSSAFACKQDGLVETGE